MALQIEYDKPESGQAFPQAYHRVLRVELAVYSGRAFIDVGVYRDAEARHAGLQPVDNKPPFSPVVVSGTAYGEYFGIAVLNNANPIKQAYLYLKSLRSYSGAIDV